MTDEPAPRPSPAPAGHGFGTAPVFLASISTILGAILFLRFGYAVSDVGLLGTLLIIAIAHLVTIPTVLAVSEIATNRRVAGGGAYYIISRSFGTRIGGVVGIALYLSQAISVAFYLVAFAEAFRPAYAWIESAWGFAMDPRFVSLPATAVLLAVVFVKGADMGVRVLWVVCLILAGSIAAFLLGSAPDAIRPETFSLTARRSDPHSFAVVFAIIFPAFTGMIAGLGLSGDLKNPHRSIPLGTIGATLAGMAIYVVVAIKLAISVSPEELHADQFVMARVAVWGPSVYIGLAAATLSSALGSILVAPRTLQALGQDRVLPFPALNRLLARRFGDAGEPRWAIALSGAIAICFVAVGDVDFIAQILTLFFLVTYGTLCTLSFLEYFAGNPSYRPTFRSRWYISLLGAVMCALLLVRMNAVHALVALVVLAILYVGISRSRRGGAGLHGNLSGNHLPAHQTAADHAAAKPRGTGLRRGVPAIGYRADQVRPAARAFRRAPLDQPPAWIRTLHPVLRGRVFPRRGATRAPRSAHPDRPDEVHRCGGICGLAHRPFPTARPQPGAPDAQHLRATEQLPAAGVRSGTTRGTRRSRGRRTDRRGERFPRTAPALLSAPLRLPLLHPRVVDGKRPRKRTHHARARLHHRGPSGMEARRDAGVRVLRPELQRWCNGDFSRLLAAERIPISEHNRKIVTYQSDDDIAAAVEERSSNADLVICGIPAATLRGADAETVLSRYRSTNDMLFVSGVERMPLRDGGAGGG